MNKIISLDQAVDLIKDGDTVMVGGFMANGTPERIVDALVAKGTKNLTLICNDAGLPDKGVGKMVMTKQFSKIIASHIGLNREAGRQMNEGETIVELIPQGTLVEQIRAGGFGLGGFLTPTGIGTLVAEGKELFTVDGKDYLLEKPIKADVALIFANKVDEGGNLQYIGSENNFNQVMAANATTTIVEAREIVKSGDLDPNFVHTPGIFVDYIVEGGE
ncbi:CoA transferase subunit A [Vagococcus fluvialis]|uniref:CoA transferase subunit A n=1 Tax=Vagococcus fluvialis TaxID=2738 RepID=UPI001432EA3C|nr:CoA transferase subunit A [Vagococcus fluvialis]MBO0478416.1 CoA transferase subunit A [Vagococcus fluvialis]MBO0484554.1 CoA transferase subunit A [Vagococcus fluvialis]MDT2746427.1 CoA transferase subunit A [Vagococcus fluvialis]MDT2780778.1 CoA transferase subunit A [Vagococcus fluvialis]NKC59510.1 CoA transferase subunit A [Vagococcus fluvialis]